MPSWADEYNQSIFGSVLKIPVYQVAEYDAYEKAMLEWQDKIRKGDPIPGPRPAASTELEQLFKDVQEGRRPRPGPGIQGIEGPEAELQKIIAAKNRQNPYSLQDANQSLAAQQALVAQMQQQAAGPSLSGMQGQQGLAQLGQQALMQGGRAGMLGSQSQGAGMAGDIGRSRLMEAMKLQAAQGSALGGAIGRDLEAQGAHQSAGLRTRELDLARKTKAQGILREIMRAQGESVLENKRQQHLSKQAREDADFGRQAWNTVKGVLKKGL